MHIRISRAVAGFDCVPSLVAGAIVNTIPLDDIGSTIWAVIFDSEAFAAVFETQHEVTATGRNTFQFGISLINAIPLGDVAAIVVDMSVLMDTLVTVFGFDVKDAVCCGFGTGGYAQASSC